MKTGTFEILRPALVLFAILTLLTGFAYPVVMTGFGKLVFPAQAAGSLVEQDGKTVGSSLIGQSFADPKYFWSRPSATSPQPNNASASGGSNLGPLNPALVDAVKGRVAALKAANEAAGVPSQVSVPQDLVTTSASGLDPEISPEAARYQAARVAAVRKLPLDAVQHLVDQFVQAPQFGLFGMPRVNVLQLNMALDAMTPA
jgi:K+-transporting ATPase ATPase C chain